MYLKLCLDPTFSLDDSSQERMSRPVYVAHVVSLHGSFDCDMPQLWSSYRISAGCFLDVWALYQFQLFVVGTGCPASYLLVSPFACRACAKSCRLHVLLLPAWHCDRGRPSFAAQVRQCHCLFMIMLGWCEHEYSLDPMNPNPRPALLMWYMAMQAAQTYTCASSSRPSVALRWVVFTQLPARGTGSTLAKGPARTTLGCVFRNWAWAHLLFEQGPKI